MRWPIALTALFLAAAAAADPPVEQARKKVRTRILTEARANRFVWDLVSFNLLDMDALNRDGRGSWRSMRATWSGTRRCSTTGEWVRTLDPVVTSPSQVGIGAFAQLAGKFLADP